MANYRDAAKADNAARHTAWVNRGKEKTRPLLTDSTGKVYLDPLTKTVVAYEDTENDLLVLKVDDGSLVHFAVWPDTNRKSTIANFIDGQWTIGPEVSKMADVGQAIEDGAVK